jgi:DNA repair protein RadA/Sms
VASLLSSVTDKPVPHNICLAGEVGLSGEIRAVNQIENRIAEAEKIGFNKIILSHYNKITSNNNKIEIQRIKHVGDLYRTLFQ